MPDIVHQCVQSKGNDGMSYPTSFDHVCHPKNMMTCYARRRPTLCAVQGLLRHAMLNVARSCVLSKRDNGMPQPTSFDRV